MPSKKDASIETLRGVAIVMMVAGHVIGHDADAGMRVADDSTWRYIYFSFEYVRLPLFTCISGFVYSLHPVTARTIRAFLVGKAHRVLLPLFFVGTLQFLLRVVIPGVNHPAQLHEVWRVYVYGTDQFWFLPAIFFIFVIAAALERFRLMHDWKGWLVFLSLVSAFQLLVPMPPRIFSLRGVVYLLPYFILGIGLNRHRDVFRPRVVGVLSLLFFGGVVVHQAALQGMVEVAMPHKMTPLALVVGLTGNALLFHFRRANRPLARLGFYAYGIYLFHVMPSAASRIALGRLGIDTPAVIFCVSLFFALGVPVVVELVILRSKVLTHLFLGLRPKGARVSAKR